MSIMARGVVCYSRILFRRAQNQNKAKVNKEEDNVYEGVVRRKICSKFFFKNYIFVLFRVCFDKKFNKCISIEPTCSI